MNVVTCKRANGWLMGLWLIDCYKMWIILPPETNWQMFLIAFYYLQQLFAAAVVRWCHLTFPYGLHFTASVLQSIEYRKCSFAFTWILFFLFRIIISRHICHIKKMIIAAITNVPINTIMCCHFVPFLCDLKMIWFKLLCKWMQHSKAFNVQQRHTISINWY